MKLIFTMTTRSKGTGAEHRWIIKKRTLTEASDWALENI